MGNGLSNFNDKLFTLHTPPLTAGHLKMVASGILHLAYIDTMGMKD